MKTAGRCIHDVEIEIRGFHTCAYSIRKMSQHFTLRKLNDHEFMSSVPKDYTIT